MPSTLPEDAPSTPPAPPLLPAGKNESEEEEEERQQQVAYSIHYHGTAAALDSAESAWNVSAAAAVVVVLGDTEATSPGLNAAKPDDTPVVVGFAKVDTKATNAANTSLAVPVAACGVAQAEEVVVADTAVKPVGKTTKHGTAANNAVVVVSKPCAANTAAAAGQASAPTSSHPNHSDS